MPQDAFTLRYLAKELNEIFSGGKVNRIVETDNDTVIFTIYNGKSTDKLMISANPSRARIAIFSGEENAPLTAPNFCMLLRKHLLSSEIKEISLVEFDRIIKITFEYKGEFSDGVEKVLYAELMGRYSNLILTENGKVLGSNRGNFNPDNGVRPIITGKVYAYPPMGTKLSPSDERLIAELKNVTEDVPSFLIEKVSGLALSTARKIVKDYAKTLSKNEGELKEIISKDPKDFFEFLNSFIYSSETKPCIELKDGKPVDVCVFPYTDGAEITFFDSLYKAENEYFYTTEKVAAFVSAKERLLRATESALKKATKKLLSLLARKKDAEDFEKNKLFGELILSNIYRLKGGEDSFEAENYYDGTVVKIPLDKTLSPQKNAERYFKKYGKQKKTVLSLVPFIKKAEDEENYLKSLRDFILLAETESELSPLFSEAEVSGIIKSQAQKKKKKEEKPFRRYFLDGFNVSVGRNNIENDRLVGGANKTDIWLHAKSCHSAHVIIDAAGKTVPEKVVRIAAEICAYYSKGRFDGKCEIAYTERKNLKKPSGAKYGLWNYTDYISLTVVPQKHEEYLSGKE